MAIIDDFSVSSAGDIRHVSGATTYTVLQLHRFLQDLADNAAASGNDVVDITSATPSERSTDNIITLLNGFNIDDTAAEYLYDGSISQDSGNIMYSGLVVVGSVYSATSLQVVQNNVLYTSFWSTGINADAAANILCRMLIKTRNTGNDIDGKKIRVQAREFGDTYAEFSVTMGLGNSTAAIFTNQDLNNTTIAGTVATWTTVSNTEGYQTIDLNNGNGAQPYYSQWNRATYTINQLYERTKWLTRRASSSTLYGMNGELFRGITHQWAYTGETGAGSWVQNDSLSWGSGATAGTACLLAVNDAGTTGTMWVQLLTGIAPAAAATVTGTGPKTCTVNGTPTARSLSPAFLGISTGSSIIGAFGIGIEAADLTKTDKLFDLLNVQQTPPNTVTFIVSGLVDSQDMVLVGPKDTGNAIKYDQLSLNTTLSSGSTAVVVATAIPSDTPTSGTIRVLDNSGVYIRCPYTSWATSTFNLTGTFGSAATAPKNVWISYIDSIAGVDEFLSFQVVYSTDRNLYVRVRDGGGTPIKTFETPATLASTGGSATAIRTSDA
jgi:hypothetical protein